MQNLLWLHLVSFGRQFDSHGINVVHPHCSDIGGDTQCKWASWHVATASGLGACLDNTFLLYQVFVTERPTIPLPLCTNRTSAMGLFMSFLDDMAITWTSYFLLLNFQALREVAPFMAGVYA